MPLTSPNLSSSPQFSSSPSSPYKQLSKRHRRRRTRRLQPRPSPTPSPTPPSPSPTNSTSSSSSSPPPPLFLSAVVPLPLFRGLPDECPIAHLTLFSRLFPSTTTHISRNFAITLSDNAALWHQLAIEPHPFMSWDETKTAFLRAFRLPESADRARTELISLRQRDGESVMFYYLRMQWILKRWEGHGLPESLVRGLFVDGLREEFHDWVVVKKPETVEEAVRIAMDWEAVSVGRRSQCQCWKHQCWKKYERSGSAVTARTNDAGNDAAAAAVAAAGAAGGNVGAISSAERIGGMMMAVGVFFLNVLFLCLQC